MLLLLFLYFQCVCICIYICVYIYIYIYIYFSKTTLSSYMWHLKSVLSETPNLKWSIFRCVPPYSNISKKSLLCLYEKLEIVTLQNQKELLNKISQLLCKCSHANKFPLKNYAGDDFR